ncbi:MAG TPA: D-alanyl-D-alanine carboxypeptidase family protein [Oscillospiraceae bacterium]|nr:D-alanyl-D-alanine carboxypeptidase family protein [Oscillospiraceae bacterium]
MKLKKRVVSISLAVLMVVMVPLQVGAISDNEVKAPSAIVMEAQTGKILYEKNSHEKRPCASITKVMTLLLVMEALDSGKIGLKDMVSASAHAASMGGSDIWLKEGETMSVDDLLKATVIMSANDAAVVLAEYVAGTEDDFVQMMNQKAEKLGMKDTTFKNCNGLDEDGHLTSAHDVAIMSAELMKHKKIFDYTKTRIDYVRAGKTQLVNSNKLIQSYKGITGLKTGTTGKAGSCVSATAERNNVSLIAVVLGCSNTKDRFASAAALLDYGFANWAMATPQAPQLSPVKVTNGMKDTVEPQVTDSGNLLVPKGKEKEVKSTVTMSDTLEAPVVKGQVIGKVTYKLGNETLKECNISAKTDVPKIDFISCYKILLKYVFHF